MVNNRSRVHIEERALSVSCRAQKSKIRAESSIAIGRMVQRLLNRLASNSFENRLECVPCRAQPQRSSLNAMGTTFLLGPPDSTELLKWRSTSSAQACCSDRS
jgi:hypothetical protein